MTYARFVDFKTQSSKFKARQRGWYALALAFFAMGLMSKPMLVTLPLVLLLLDFWPFRRFQWPASRKLLTSLVLEKIPFLVLAALSCVVTVWAQAKSQAIGSFESYPMDFRIANSLAACLTYIQKMLWPVGLSVFYPYPLEAPVEKAALAFLVVGCTLFVAFKLLRSRPYFAVGFLWYLVTLVPVLGLVQVGGHSVADRYTYIPLIGLFVVIVWSAADTAGTSKKSVAALSMIGVTVLAACCLLTSRQIGYWRDNPTLFGHALALDDRNDIAMLVLGDAAATQGDNAKALTYFQQALRVHQNNSTVWLCLARSLKALGHTAEAEDAFKKALQFKPNAQNYCDYADLLINLGRLDEAQALLDEARIVNASLAQLRFVQALLFEKQGRLEEAIKEYEAILQFNPLDEAVRVRCATLYFVSGKPELAAAAFREVLRAQPENFTARIFLGRSLLDLHDLAGAETEFSTLLKTNPRNARALDGLGFTLAQKGSLAEAAARLTQAIEIDPNYPDAHLHYAMCLIAQNRPQQAAAEFRKTLELNPDQLAVLNNLAWMLAAYSDPAIRNGPEAVTLAERACKLTNEQQPFYLGTLAAAYAEAGRFPEAVATAEKARDLANRMGWTGVVTRNEQLLELYRVGKPFHESEESP